MIGVVTALQQESRVLRQCLCAHKAKVERGHYLWEGGDRVIVIESGMSVHAAGEGAELLIRHYPVHCLYALGFAGGIAASVRTGEVVIGSQIYSPPTGAGVHTSPIFSADLSLAKPVQEACQRAGLCSHTGALLTVDRVIGSRVEKRQLQAQYPVLAVDMESGGVAAVAHRYRLPFLAIRVIFDEREEDLPASLSRLSDTHGRIQLGPVLIYLATHASALPTLLRMTRRWWKAQQALRAFCQSWLSGIDGE